MKRVFVPEHVENYELCHPLDPEDFDRIIVQVNGAPRAATWVAPLMRLITETQGRTRPRSDSPWLGPHALMFRPAAVAALEPLLTAHGEVLPLRLDRPPHPEDAGIRMYNPTRVLDVLDEAASQLWRFPSSGGIMRIIRYAFRPDGLPEGVHVFKIPNLRASPTFVTDEVVRRWTAAGLRGLEWREVWAG